jgi:uncharacterized protein YjbI with pentapeptide repeats
MLHRPSREKINQKIKDLDFNFDNLDLSGWDFYCVNGDMICGALLMNASFQNSDLRRAKFNGASLHGANFLNANLEDAFFYDARFDNTIMPDGSIRSGICRDKF